MSCKLCTKGQKHFIFNKIGYMDLYAPIPKFAHHHLIQGEHDPHEDLHPSLKWLLAFVATNVQLRGTNGIRRLHQEDMNNNMRKMGNNKNMEGNFFVLEQTLPTRRCH